MRIGIKFGGPANASVFGGKNHWTGFLLNENFPVPDSIFLSCGTYAEYSSFLNTPVYEDFLEGIDDGRYCVRSSSPSEDGNVSSNAGKYLSIIDVSKEEIKDSILQVVKSANGDRMGILLQKVINPSYSGVIFSSNPLTKCRGEMVINYVSGFGDKLMSGDDKGTSLVVNYNSLSLERNSPINEALLRVIEMVKTLEDKLGFPVDVEWCVEKNTNKVYLVQCRPVTGVLYKENVFLPVNEELGKYKDIASDDKIKLRLIGKENNIYVSPAYIIRCNCLTKEMPDLDISFTPTKMTTGYSVVVISPKVINGKIMRSFAGVNEKKTIKCNRYGVRLSTGSYGELVTCIKDMYKKLKNVVWSFTLIIQEVFDPYVTGILKRSNTGFIMEILRGHFAAKGIFPMSKYACDNEYNIIYKNEVYQSSFYLLVNGNKTLFPNDDNDQLVSLPNKDISNIFRTMSPLFNVKGLNIEFGVLKEKEEYKPYLIDYSVENEEAIDLNSVTNGVISRGKVVGKTMKIDAGDVVGAIDTHFYNHVKKKKIVYDNAIFLCDIPSISLLEILEESSENIGFVFKEGSSLCHFAVTLRERNIPAIVGVDIHTISNDEVYTLDTDKTGNVEDKLYK